MLSLRESDPLITRDSDQPSQWRLVLKYLHSNMRICLSLFLFLYILIFVFPAYRSYDRETQNMILGLFGLAVVNIFGERQSVAVGYVS